MIRTPNHASRDTGLGRVKVLAVLGALLLLGGAAAEEARGGIYVVAQCHPQENRSHLFAVDRNTPDYATFAECNPGGRGLGVYRASNAGYTEGGRFGSWWVTIPSGVSARRLVAQVHSRQDSSHVPRLGAFIDGAPNAYLYTNNKDPFQGATLSTGVGGRTFFVQMLCVKPRTETCAPTVSTPHIYARSLLFELQDTLAPAAPTVGGPLVAGGVRAGAEQVHGASADGGSGLERFRVRVNGALAAQAPQPCQRSLSGQMASTFVPCPRGQRPYALTLDTERPPWRNGANSLRVCARDYSGEEACAPVRTVHVDNSCPSSAPGGESLRASIGGRSSATVRSDRPVRVAGRLLSGGGGPIAGATVCLYERIHAPGARRRQVASARTGPGGRFAATLRPGPSRTVTVAYRHGSRIRSAAVTVRSRVVPAFAVRPRAVGRGRCARLRGRIPGPRNAGRVLNFQARVGEGRQRRWVNFHNGRTVRGGVFRGRRYCFRATSGPRRYSLRVLVKRQAGYPYLRGASRPVAVRVR